MKSLRILAFLTAVCGLVQCQTVTILPSPLVGTAGENIDITCVGPEPVSLTLEAETIPGTFTAPGNLFGRRIDMANRSVFTIGPLTMDDDGVVYRCSFPSPTPIRDSATLSVQFPPTLTLIGEADRTVTEGVNVMFNITITGNPPPTLSDLTFEKVDGSPSVEPVLEDGIVVVNFPSVARTDSGDYTLTATNTLGDDSVAFSLDVQFPPMFGEDLSETFVCEDPGVDDTIIRCAGMVGATDTLLCDVVGNPTPTLIRTTTATDTSTINDFTITTANADNTGNYTCSAVNVLDTIVRQFELFIGSRPATVNNLMVVISDSRMFTNVNWDYDDPDNAVPLDGFVLGLFQGTQMILTFRPYPGDQMFMIPLACLQTNEDYRVTLVGRNLLGDSLNHAEAQFQTPDMIPTIPMTTTECASATSSNMGAVSTAASVSITAVICSLVFFIAGTLFGGIVVYIYMKRHIQITLTTRNTDPANDLYEDVGALELDSPASPALPQPHIELNENAAYGRVQM